MNRSLSNVAGIVLAALLAAPLTTSESILSMETLSSSGALAAQEKEAIGYQQGQPFSPAVRAGNTIYFSGRLGLSQEVRAMEPGADRVREEVRLIMESFREIFDEAGVGFEDVVKATVFITDLDYYDALNEVYVEYFPEDAPARAAVEVSGLVAGAMVEIAFIAVQP